MRCLPVNGDEAIGIVRQACHAIGYSIYCSSLQYLSEVVFTVSLVLFTSTWYLASFYTVSQKSSHL